MHTIKRLKADVEAAKALLRSQTETLVDAYYTLQVGTKQDETDKAEEELRRAQDSCSAQLSEIVSLAHRISGAASAPASYNPALGLPIAFLFPAPQMEQIRASVLFQREEMERLPKPEIRVSGCEEPDYLKVDITCTAEGAVLKYTMDGSIPTEALGMVYSKAILIEREADCVIKAVATKAGYMESEIAVLARAEPAMPKVIRETMMERPQHVMPNGMLDLGFGYSPPSSSRYSDDDEFKSPSLP